MNNLMKNSGWRRSLLVGASLVGITFLTFLFPSECFAGTFLNACISYTEYWQAALSLGAALFIAVGLSLGITDRPTKLSVIGIVFMVMEFIAIPAGISSYGSGFLLALLFAVMALCFAAYLRSIVGVRSGGTPRGTPPPPPGTPPAPGKHSLSIKWTFLTILSLAAFLFCAFRFNLVTGIIAAILAFIAGWMLIEGAKAWLMFMFIVFIVAGVGVYFASGWIHSHTNQGTESSTLFDKIAGMFQKGGGIFQGKNIGAETICGTKFDAIDYSSDDAKFQDAYLHKALPQARQLVALKANPSCTSQAQARLDAIAKVYQIYKK